MFFSQYCGSADHQSSTCPQAEVWSTCKTKKHGLKYMCLILKGGKKLERYNKGYKYDNHPEQLPLINDRTRNIQITPIVGLCTTISNQISHTEQQNICFGDEFPQGKITHRTQQAVLGYHNISLRGSLRNSQYHLPTRSNVDNQNPTECDGAYSSQMPPTGQSITLFSHWEEMEEMKL